MPQEALVFGPEQVPVVAMMTLRAAIRLYSKTGIKVNSAYTPTRMRNTAERWTGKKFKRGDWTSMIEELSIKIESAGG